MTHGGSDTMAAAVFRGPGRIAVEHRPVPTPGAGEALVEVSYCGICGTDLHLMLEGWGTPGRVFGHEWSGTIAALGDEVVGWSVGDRVVGGVVPGCGTCRNCRAGRPTQCATMHTSVTDERDGAFAGYATIDARALVPIPPGLSDRAAALTEPLAIAAHAVNRSGVETGDTVLVIGAGPVGALIVAVLATTGVGPITVVEPGAARRELSVRLGATATLHPDDLVTFPMWEPEDISPHAADIVFECSGRKSAMEAGFHQLRRGGTLVLVGSGIEPPSFDPNRMILNEVTVCGSFNYDVDGFERALDLLAGGSLPLDLLIAPDDVPLDGLTGALHDLSEGRIAGKAMVVPRAAEPIDPSSTTTPITTPEVP